MPRIKKTGIVVVPKSKRDGETGIIAELRRRMRENFEADPDSMLTKKQREMRKRMRKKFEVDPGSNLTKEEGEMRKRMRERFYADPKSAKPKTLPKKPKTKKPPAKPKAPKKPKTKFKKRDLLYRGKSATPKRKRSREV